MPRKYGVYKYRKRLNTLIEPLINNLEEYLNKIILNIIKGNDFNIQNEKTYWSNLEKDDIWVQYRVVKRYI